MFLFSIPEDRTSYSRKKQEGKNFTCNIISKKKLPYYGSVFTLIERERLDNTSESSPVKSPESMNCSFHIDSLTAGECGDARTGCAVTKSRERKPPVYGGSWPVPKALHGNVEQQIAGHLNMEDEVTGSQSGRQGKHTGRTVGTVKVSRHELLVESGVFG